MQVFRVCKVALYKQLKYDCQSSDDYTLQITKCEKVCGGCAMVGEVVQERKQRKSAYPTSHLE